MSRVPPHDLDAEAAVLGALLVFPQAIEVRTTLVPEDFYGRGNAAVFAAILAVHDSGGNHGDAVQVRDQMVRDGATVDSGRLVELQARASAAWRRTAHVIARLAALRRLVGLLGEASNEAWDPGTDPAEVVDRVRAGLQDVDVPLGRPSRDLYEFDEFVAREAVDVQWVIPNLLGRQHRAVVVAPEGVAKSSLFRQIALLASQGLHPFTLRPMQPIRVLFADFENPEDSIRMYSRPILAALQKRMGAAYDRSRMHIWHRPGGVNLRTRSGRSELEANIAAVRPDLLCVGPLYKCYRATAKESDELAVGEVQPVLDDLRTRFDVAMLLEHHAPHGAAGRREMRAHGTVLWTRWPEFGLGLSPTKEPKGSLDVTRFRGDRIAAAWPDRLDLASGVPWRWSGFWRDGMPDHDGAEPF